VLHIFVVIVAVTPISIACVLAYMGYMTADRNGWKRLARRFRHHGPSPAHTLHFQSATLNGFAFPMTMVFGVGAEGLFLRPALPVRMFHPPLLLPWEELRSSRFVRRHSRGLKLTLEDPDQGDVTFDLQIPETSHTRLIRQADASWDAARAILDPP
jgi:hypothetical protein